MKTLLAVAALLLFAPLVLGGARAPLPAKAAAHVDVTVTFQESASRVTLGQETLSLSLDGKIAEKAVALGGSVAGWKLRTLSREINVDGKVSGIWVELTVVGADGKEAAYLALTLPREPITPFSAATKAHSGTPGADLNVVLSRP